MKESFPRAFLSRSKSLALVFSADMKTFRGMMRPKDPHLIQLFNSENPSSSHSVSNVALFDLREIKKTPCAVFPDRTYTEETAQGLAEPQE